jgi:hypothetical protein
MHLDYPLYCEDDLKYFKGLFFGNIGVEQILYKIRSGDLMIQLQVSSLEENQLVSIGFFDIEESPGTTSIKQFVPTKDKRFANFDIVKQVWIENPNVAWAYMTLLKGEEDAAYQVLHELLRTAYKVNKLKAFS